MTGSDWDIVVNLPPKTAQRQQITADVERFLRDGGRVQQFSAVDNAEARFTPSRTRRQALDDMKRANYRGAAR
jgi:hypothetical protein